MKTLTNQIKITFDSNAIDKRFDIFQIRSNGKYIQRGAKVLDLGLKGIKSIVFDDGASAFVLFDKSSIKSFELQEIVTDDLMVKKIYVNELKPYIVARLMLNALSNSEFDEFAFSNLTGKLYLFKSEWISSSRKSFKSLNVDIKSFGEDSAKITCSACTFTLAKLFKSPKITETYPRYIFSVKNTLKRVFENDDNSYIKRSRGGKKAEIPFVSFYKDKMKLCKSYLLSSVIDSFNNAYIGLICIELIERQIEKKIEAKKDAPFFTKVVELLSGKMIYLVNMDHAIEDEETFKYMASRMQEMIPSTNFIVSDNIKPKEMNIVLIHNQEFYKDNNLSDPYTTFDRSTPIQCVTLEDACFKDSDVIYKTILKELEIKNEIINRRKILIDNWEEYGFKGSFIFGTIFNNLAYFLNIAPNGEFKLIKKSSVFSAFKEPLYDELEKQLFSIKGDDKLIIADDVGNINVITDSGITPLPNKEVFFTDSPRGNASKVGYLAGVLDINLYKKNNLIEYSSGPIGKAVNTSIPTAPHIYTIQVKNGEEKMTSLLETLGVQFVKYNSFTVIPYPFKFLKEWILMNKEI